MIFADFAKEKGPLIPFLALTLLPEDRDSLIYFLWQLIFAGVRLDSFTGIINTFYNIFVDFGNNLFFKIDILIVNKVDNLIFVLFKGFGGFIYQRLRADPGNI